MCRLDGFLYRRNTHAHTEAMTLCRLSQDMGGKCSLGGRLGDVELCPVAQLLVERERLFVVLKHKSSCTVKHRQIITFTEFER